MLQTDNKNIKEKQQKLQHATVEHQKQQEISKILSQTKSFFGQHEKEFKDDFYETKLPAKLYKSSGSKKELQKQYEKYQKEGRYKKEENYETLKEMHNKTQVIQSRSQIQENVNRNLFQFLDNFKIVLTQIVLNDDSNTNTLAAEIKLQNAYNQSINFFQQFDDSFTRTTTYVYLEDNFKQKTLQIDQKKITFYKQNIDQKKFFKDKNRNWSRVLYKQFLQIFSTNIEYSIEKHDQWIETFYNFCYQVVDRRIQLCVEYFQNNFDSEKDMKEQVEKMSQQLQKKLSEVLIFYKPCNYKDFNKCQQCSRKCAMSESHIGSCNCYTDHKCLIYCNKKNCPCKNQSLCQEQYGHYGYDHGCPNQQNLCKTICSIDQCQRRCKKGNSIPHQIHNCQMNHQCQQKCCLNQCNEMCVKSLEEIHETHQCQNQICPIKCDFCDKTCDFKNHFHDNDVQSSHNNFSYHDCGNEHQCQQLCEHDGICQVIYQPCQDVHAFDQILVKNKCTKMIPPHKTNHTGQHICSSNHNKRCRAKCPQCKIMCSKSHGHEGLHFHLEHQQRNVFILSSEDQQKFLNVTSNYEIISTILNQGPKRNCIDNCKRMRRNDIHLVECSQLDSCQVEQLERNQARHPIRQEEPPVDIIDCPQFFEIYGWEKPSIILNNNN